jgi:hypothetical protein
MSIPKLSWKNVSERLTVAEDAAGNYFAIRSNANCTYSLFVNSERTRKRFNSFHAARLKAEKLAVAQEVRS